jgi:DNA-binding protein H-NS
MLTLLLKAIQNLTRLGTIKSVQQAYQLAKRELGDQFNAAKKQIDDAFNQGKKQQTLDKRTKEMSATERQFNKDVEEAGGMEEFLNKNPIDDDRGIKSLKTSKIEKEADKLKKSSRRK